MENVRKRKTKIGKVVSDSMDKSISVLVERTVLEPRFKKYVRKKKKFMAHDENNECRAGDTVRISECRPLSKKKRWRVDSILEKTTD
ncbi:MAG: 30S ribosomal protein S17 [Deltaproteobacteria bacterium]|jgi:small subunit ribosomal protein S17|nr:30S ribosomal protein S17 [Deltaproteobacteria bacterium]